MACRWGLLRRFVRASDLYATTRSTSGLLSGLPLQAIFAKPRKKVKFVIPQGELDHLADAQRWTYQVEGERSVKNSCRATRAAHRRRDDLYDTIHALEID